MALDTDIAALPGGHELATMVAQIAGAPDFLHAVAGRLTSAFADSAGASDAVRLAVTQLGQTWAGSSATAFADFMAQFAQGSQTLHDSGYQVAAVLTQLAESFEQAQTAIKTIGGNLLIQVAQLRTARPGAPPGSLDPDITALVTEATDAARASITTFETALEQAGTVLSSELPVFGRAFSALPQPGDPNLVFDSGKPAAPATLPAHIDATTTSKPGTGGRTVLAAVTQPGPGKGGSSQVDTWIDEATKVLVASGVAISKLDHQTVALVIEHESGGDPSAVNTWDSNAAAGTPSIGLMQTIAPTFNAYALSGHNDINNPVDNIIAGVRYALARYGSLENLPGVIAVRNGQPYVGY